MNDLAIGFELQGIALRIRRDRTFPEVYAMALRAVVATTSVREAALGIHKAVTDMYRQRPDHQTPDDDEYAIDFGSMCMAVGIRVKLLYTADERSPRVRVAVCVQTTPDEASPSITRDVWEAFEAAYGATSWPSVVTRTFEA